LPIGLRFALVKGDDENPNDVCLVPNPEVESVPTWRAERGRMEFEMAVESVYLVRAIDGKVLLRPKPIMVSGKELD